MRPGLIPRLQAQYGTRHFLAGLGALLGSADREGLALPDSELELLPVSSGRAGLYLILKALGLPPGSGVAVPLYCCPTVFEAVRRAGHRPVFIDSGKADHAMSARALREAMEGHGEIAAVVVVHMFGFPAQIEEIIGAAAGRPVIEDCAHAVGTRTEGRQVGGDGVASFFSFGRGKWPAVGGGAVCASDTGLRSALRSAIEALPGRGRASEATRAVRTLAMSAAYRPPWYGLFALGLAERLDSRVDLRGLREFHVGGMDRADQAVLSRRLGEFPADLAVQRRHAAQLLEALRDQPVELPDWRPEDEPNWYLFPLRFGSREQRDAVRQHLRRRGVDTMAYLSDIAGLAQRDYGYEGNCPNAERASDRTLIVPHYHSLSPRQMERVAESVRESLTAPDVAGD
jgi:perosamine synthetase